MDQVAHPLFQNGADFEKWTSHLCPPEGPGAKFQGDYLQSDLTTICMAESKSHNLAITQKGALDTIITRSNPCRAKKKAIATVQAQHISNLRNVNNQSRKRDRFGNYKPIGQSIHTEQSAASGIDGEIIKENYQAFDDSIKKGESRTIDPSGRTISKPTQPGREKRIRRKLNKMPNILWGDTYNPLTFTTYYDLDRGVKTQQLTTYQVNGRVCTKQSLKFRLGKTNAQTQSIMTLPRKNNVTQQKWRLPLYYDDANPKCEIHRIAPTPLDTYEIKVPDHLVTESVETIKKELKKIDIRQQERQFLRLKTTDLSRVKIRIFPFNYVAELVQLLENGKFTEVIFTTRDEDISRLCAKDLREREIEFMTYPKEVFRIRKYFQNLGYHVEDDMCRIRGLQIFYISREEYEQKAKDYVTEQWTLLSQDTTKSIVDIHKEIVDGVVHFPFKAYVIFELNQRKSPIYNDDFIKQYNQRLYTCGPVLSVAQTEQLLDAYYWTHLAPDDKKKDYSDIITFYENNGRRVKLKEPHTRNGKSIGRTSASGKLRKFNPLKMKFYNFQNSKHVKPAGDSESLVAKKKATPRKKKTFELKSNTCADNTKDISTVPKVESTLEKFLQQRKSKLTNSQGDQFLASQMDAVYKSIVQPQNLTAHIVRSNAIVGATIKPVLQPLPSHLGETPPLLEEVTKIQPQMTQPLMVPEQPLMGPGEQALMGPEQPPMVPGEQPQLSMVPEQPMLIQQFPELPEMALTLGEDIPGIYTSDMSMQEMTEVMQFNPLFDNFFSEPSSTPFTKQNGNNSSSNNNHFNGTNNNSHTATPANDSNNLNGFPKSHTFKNTGSHTIPSKTFVPTETNWDDLDVDEEMASQDVIEKRKIINALYENQEIDDILRQEMLDELIPPGERGRKRRKRNVSKK